LLILTTVSPVDYDQGDSLEAFLFENSRIFKSKGQIPSWRSRVFCDKIWIKGRIIFQYAIDDMDEFTHSGADDEHFGFTFSR